MQQPESLLGGIVLIELDPEADVVRELAFVERHQEVAWARCERWVRPLRGWCDIVLHFEALPCAALFEPSSWAQVVVIREVDHTTPTKGLVVKVGVDRDALDVAGEIERFGVPVVNMKAIRERVLHLGELLYHQRVHVAALGKACEEFAP